MNVPFARLKEERSRGYELGPEEGHQWVVGWRDAKRTIEPALKPAYVAINQLPFAYTDEYSHSGSLNDHERSLKWLANDNHTGHLTLQLDPTHVATETFLRDVQRTLRAAPLQDGRHRIEFTVPQRLRSDLDEYESFVRQQWKILKGIATEHFVNLSLEFRIDNLQPTVDYNLPQRIALFTDFIGDDAYGLLRPPNIVIHPNYPNPLIADGHCLLFTLQQFGQDTVRVPLKSIHEAKGDVVIPETGKLHRLADLERAAYFLSAAGITTVSSLPVSLNVEEADGLEGRLSGSYGPSAEMSQKETWEILWRTKEVAHTPNQYAEIILQHLNGTGHILDVGCGDGRDSIYFLEKGFRVTGIDIAENALRKAREQASPFKPGSYRFLQVDLTRDQISEGDYIAAYAHLSLQFFDHETTKEVFRRIAEALPPGARFFVKVKSTKDARYGEGVPLGEHMFFDDRLRHFFTPEYLRQLTNPHFQIDAIRETSHTYSNYVGSFIEAEMTKK